MSRPKNERIVHNPPLFTQFKPVGVNPRMLNSVTLSLDEYEAIRLADFEGQSHAESAEEMEISRSTFSRLIENARKKTATFFIKGSFLNIEGGNIHFRTNIVRCIDCGYMFKINFTDIITECPACQSKNLLNLAGGFGHGKCCDQNQKKDKK